MGETAGESVKSDEEGWVELLERQLVVESFPFLLLVSLINEALEKCLAMKYPFGREL